MEFLSIKLAKNNTLEVKYKNEDGDIVAVQGANIVHKDLRKAMNALIPHMAVITEQREACQRNLSQLQAMSITDEGNESIFKRLDVDTVQLSDAENDVTISGCRILLSGGVVKLVSPCIHLNDDEGYQYKDELALDLDALRFEAKAYIEEKKWGVKEQAIDFGDPFEGVEAGDVPEAEAIDMQPKKRGRKPKKAA